MRPLGLAEFVEFTGRVPDETVAAILSSADVGISPDPKNSFNDVCTMNKTMEYMAFGLPVVAFDLCETRVSAADAALYATPNDVGELTRLLVDLIDDEPRRRLMGQRLAPGWSRSSPGAIRPLGTLPCTSASYPTRLVTDWSDQRMKQVAQNYRSGELAVLDVPPPACAPGGFWCGRSTRSSRPAPS